MQEVAWKEEIRKRAVPRKRIITIKAPKRKRKTRTRAVIGPSPSLDEARAWFKDYENLAVKLGKV